MSVGQKVLSFVSSNDKQFDHVLENRIRLGTPLVDIKLFYYVNYWRLRENYKNLK